MVFGEAAAGAAAGAHALWNYNRDNFLFDRKMRAENEYKILEWRSTQAELWRDDIRDIIGLTEKKMDNYLIVATLQLGMSVALFTEGRLEPGTPPWLLHFYMLTLGAAFMYLLMAVWFAMHASIVATCSSVRLLTQFVRLPVPTWEQIEGMRTYASTYETLEAGHMLRVPFTGKPVPPSGTEGALASSSSSLPAGPKQRRPSEPIDPWGLEMHGASRELYELQESPAALRRHVELAKKAARQYQCFDAFARVAMSFGTNQLLMAIGYYCLGYVAVQDGAPWPAWCIVCIMTAIAIALVHLDFSLTRKEQLLAQVLNFTGPAAASAVTVAWALRGVEAEPLMLTLLPVAYASHGLWLLFALVCCGMELQPNGSILPLKFRAVLYLDVFGWLSKGEQAAEAQDVAAAPAKAKAKAKVLKKGDYQALPLQPAESAPPQGPAAPSHEELSLLRDGLRGEARLWRSAHARAVMEDHERERIDKVLGRMESFDGAAPSKMEAALASERGQPESEPSERRTPSERRMLILKSYTDFGTEVPYLLDPESGETRPCEDEGGGLEREFPAEPEASPRVPRSISHVEEDVERYCSHRALYKQGLQQGRAAAGAPATSAKPGDASDFLGALGLEAAKLALDVLGEEETDEYRYVAGRESESAWTAPNPSGQVHESPGNIFHPQSYVPGEAKELSPTDDSYIVTGHDKIHPGKLPAKIFRLGTLLLVVLWAIGVLMPFGVFREFVTHPLTANVVVEEMGPHGRIREEEVKAAVGTAPDGLPELIPEYNLRQDLPSLPEGSLVNVDWPMHAGFVPRALSSDPTGTMFVVADDLGVYAGRLVRDAAEVANAASSAVVARGLQEAGALHTGTVSFEHVPPCSALEGQALKDISVVCSPGTFDSCHVVVLHGRGRKLAECPLPTNVGGQDMAEARGLVDGDGVEEFGVDPVMVPAEPAATWKISNDWLGNGGKQREYVNSVAVNSECLSAEGQSSVSTFHPDLVGCVVVGTTSGRIVQLRTAFSGERRLVPERAMEQRTRGVGPGSLHVLPAGFVVALRHRSGTVQAFDSKHGVAVGEWKLPKGIQWLTLCGSAESLFVLGLRGGTHVELHRFPLPAILTERASDVSPRLSADYRTWRLRRRARQTLPSAAGGESVEEI